MYACEWEIGNNLSAVLVGIGASVAPILAGIGLYINTRVHKTVNTTAAAVERTETKVDTAASLTSGGSPIAPAVRPFDIRDQEV